MEKDLGANIILLDNFWRMTTMTYYVKSSVGHMWEFANTLVSGPSSETRSRTSNSLLFHAHSESIIRFQLILIPKIHQDITNGILVNY